MIFIAEIGMNHNGNFGLIYELIRQASWSGANIAKFQLGWRCGPNEINALDIDTINLIDKCCEKFSIEPMFSIITPEAFTLIKNRNYNRYKIASRTVIDNPSLVKDILSQNRETYISLGMYKGAAPPFGIRNNIFYLWCISKYPTYPWELHNFPESFTDSIYSGYSDHTIGIEVPLIAITRGAKIIEKHFTLDKSDTTIRDHALSATPEEFSQLVKIGTSIHTTLKSMF